MLSRRALAAAPALLLRAQTPPRILLRGSWQSVNIGDIGHTPGALSLLAKYFPEAEITLWPGKLGHGSRDFLLANFPRLRIAEGSLGPDQLPNSPALAQAWREADLYLSGSGSGFPASNHALAFRKATNKPLGVFGVSTDPVSGFGPDRDPEGGTLNQLRARALALPPTHLPPDLRFVINASSFFFCRDTISRDYLRRQNLSTPLLEFGPDTQLGMSARDDARANAFLQSHSLTPGRFSCFIPRLRYTPYYRVDNRPRQKDDDAKDAINARTTEPDHRKIRELITAYVRQTKHKALVCAEMTYQVELGKQALVDPLPDDVKPHVVWRDSYWLPDEAASVYAQALAVVSLECHSPLIAYRNGTPAFYVRQPTDTSKGQMYRDFGAADCFFEVDEATPELLWSRLAKIAQNPTRARRHVRQIMSTVESHQRRMVDAARAACRRGSHSPKK